MSATTTGPAQDHRQAVTYLAGRWVQEGTRNTAFGALAGGLLREGVPVDTAEEILRALAEATGDDPVEARVKRVADTAAALKADRNTTGWPALLKLLGPNGGEYVAHFRQLLGLTL